MTQQQMTDEQIQAAGNRIGTAQARAQRPLKEAGWLLRLPEADVNQPHHRAGKGAVL